MISKKEKIRLIIGFLIVVGIFIFLFVSSCDRKDENISSFINLNKDYNNTLPSHFSDEVFNIDDLDYSNLLVDDTGKIVGFSLDKNPVDSYSLIKAKLSENNWKFVESGSNAVGSFSKQDSEISWLFLNCIAVGDGTSVVITCN